MLFLQSNIGNILKIIVAAVVFFLFGDVVKAIPLFLVIILCYLDFTIFNASFEYQRITLILARIAKAHNSSLSIGQLQLLMTNNKITPWMLIDSILAGLIIGYFILTSWVFLIIYFVVKYLLGVFIPTYKPYSVLFEYVGQELKNNTATSATEYMEKVKLEEWFNEMPKNRSYEQWAFTKYQA